MNVAWISHKEFLEEAVMTSRVPLRCASVVIHVAIGGSLRRRNPVVPTKNATSYLTQPRTQQSRSIWRILKHSIPNITAFALRAPVVIASDK